MTHELPLDSNDFPISVLIQGDDSEGSYCDQCLRPAVEFPRLSYGYPAAIYQAAIYCGSCKPISFVAETGEQVSTLTGVSIQ